MLAYTVLFFVLINISYCEKSFTIVLDSTFSMKEELIVIQANIRALNINETNFENYILLSFKDKSVDPPYIYNNFKDLVHQINSVSASAPTHVCPENSLGAIEDALRFSKPESNIFVFTDAYAKDYNRLDNIKHLCRESHSQVTIFLSGYCLPSAKTETGNVEVYRDIVNTCSGVLFQLNTNEMRQVTIITIYAQITFPTINQYTIAKTEEKSTKEKLKIWVHGTKYKGKPLSKKLKLHLAFLQAFKFMTEITKQKWTDITPHETFNEFQEFTVTLDSFTTDFVIVAAGDHPEVDVVNNYQNQAVERIIDTRHALVTSLVNTDPGTYTVKVRGHGSNSVTVYERSQMSFEYGFSTRNPNDFRETAKRPIPGYTNYILIQIDYTTIQLTEIEWLTYKENVKKVLYLDNKRPGLYVTSVYVEHEKSFKLWIKGRTSETYQNIKGSTRTLFPQVTGTELNPTWMKPQAEIFEPETNMVDFGNNITLICKVVGYPKPNITWENEDNVLLPSEDILLEIPNVSLSYMTLTNASKNTTIYCKCDNGKGIDSQSMDIYVNRTFSFNVLQSPKDTDVEYGNELKLYCEIDAYPEATVTWYLNQTKLETAYIDDNALIIDNVGLDDTGLYECLASNGIERRQLSAEVTVTGIEAPEIDKDETEVSLKPNDRKELYCSVNKGKPKPVITWTYKSLEAFQFDKLPSGIEEEDGVLKMLSADKKYGGTYRCSATNIIGEDIKDVVVKIQHAPLIKHIEQDSIAVEINEEVRLECEVDSSPAAEVRWELTQDDVSINIDEHYKIDKWNTLSFVARWNDSGRFNCIAENSVGKADKSIFVNILVAPFIDGLSQVINIREGSNVTLACNVLYGNPAPTLKWEYRAPNSAPRILRHNSNSALQLTNVSKLQEGKYMCVVENSVDNDRIIYTLKVHV